MDLGCGIHTHQRLLLLEMPAESAGSTHAVREGEV